MGQLSRDGIEAGASVLAAQGDAVFAAWQELPGHGAPSEIRAGKLAVPTGP